MYITASRIGAALLCLVLFLSGQFHAQFQHYLSHSAEHEALHHHEAELDACHQSVFHAGSQTACEHPTHLTETKNNCELCDCLLQIYELELVNTVISASPGVNQRVFCFLMPKAEKAFLLATARGPPFRFS